MKTREIAEQAENLPKKGKMAILEIIDQKVESDMDKVLERMDTMNSTLNSRMDRLSSSLKWSIGIGFTLLGLLITILNFLK